jgi:hypothetical protein
VRRRGGCLARWVNALPVAKPCDGGESRKRQGSSSAPMCGRNGSMNRTNSAKPNTKGLFSLDFLSRFAARHLKSKPKKNLRCNDS